MSILSWTYISNNSNHLQVPWSKTDSKMQRCMKSSNCSLTPKHINCIWNLQVRIYTPKRVFQELEVAKEEYIRTTFRLHKGQKVLLPKLVESFSKESGLCQAGLVEIIEHCMPNSLGKGIHWGQHGKFWKSIEWTPHNFTFRYLLSRELLNWLHALIHSWNPQGKDENNSHGDFKMSWIITGFFKESTSSTQRNTKLIPMIT